jgi:hypothetical protein
MIALAITKEQLVKAFGIAMMCGRHGIAPEAGERICAALVEMITSGSTDQLCSAHALLQAELTAAGIEPAAPPNVH